MEAEEAERVVRTVHEAAARALDRLPPAENTMGADARQAALTGVLDEFNASVESVLASWAEMISVEFVHPHIDVSRSQLSLGSILAMRSRRRINRMDAYLSLHSVKSYLDSSIDRLDRPQTDAPPQRSGGAIGSRPSAGPGFYGAPDQRQLYERAQAYVQAAASGQNDVSAQPERDSTESDADLVPEVSAPYDDLREPWYRRLRRRNRPASGSPQ
ncbi:hypothetical protein ACF07F_24635 [Streptomyces sp. NPDC015237]|uniref:hypothetical protein n=1 Tax=unclassified Streptomyces TaxID=2593676 RepID=UPI0036FA651E